MRIKVPPGPRRTGDRNKASLAPRACRFASCKDEKLRILADLSKSGCSGANMSQYERNLTSRSFLIANRKRTCGVVGGVRCE